MINFFRDNSHVSAVVVIVQANDQTEVIHD